VACPLNCKCGLACHLLYQYFVICLGHRRVRWDMRSVQGRNTVLIVLLPFVLSYCLTASGGKVLSSSPRESTFTSSGTWPTLNLHNSSSFRVFAVNISPIISTNCLVHVNSSPLSLSERNISNFHFFAHKHNTTKQSIIPVLKISYLRNGKSNLNKLILYLYGRFMMHRTLQTHCNFFRLILQI
jgi:hypothetical protein